MTRPRVCVTVTGETTAELRARRDAVRDADLVELRLDTVRDPDVATALADRRLPVIVTCRPVWEGGSFLGSEGERRRLLGEALAAGAEYVDVEWRARFTDLLTQPDARRIVLSLHVFNGVPADLPELARAMRATGAGVTKIAVQAARLSDCVQLLELGEQLKNTGEMILIGMGEPGAATRILAGRLGSAWTYAGSLEGIGQLNPASLLTDYHFRDIGEATALYGLTGSPIAHSVSPAMHNAAIRAAGRDAVYLPLPAADADDFVQFARAFGLKGASVTIPFKVPLFERLQNVDAVARQVGAINTIRIADGGWQGTNTDVSGFLRPLRDRGVALRGLRAAVLGAGGSARAVAIALSGAGASVCVHARQTAQARSVAELAGAQVGPLPPEPRSWDLLVNCTPIGMHPRIDDTPVPAERLMGGRLVYDLVYNPVGTRLLREAAAAGCQTIGGLDMLVAQAEEQFQYWMGEPPPAGVMHAAAVKRLTEFATDEAHVI